VWPPPAPVRNCSRTESRNPYPGAIWLGPRIIAVNSPAHGTRRTGLMKVVVSVPKAEASKEIPF
jgi:hypothetical protein